MNNKTTAVKIVGCNRRLWSVLAATALVSLVTGCSLCCGPHDYEYPMFQTRYGRMDPEYGRVGSAFTDPNVGIGPAPLSNADVESEDMQRDNRDMDLDNDGPDDPDFPRTRDPFEGEDPDTFQDTTTPATYDLPAPTGR